MQARQHVYTTGTEKGYMTAAFLRPFLCFKSNENFAEVRMQRFGSCFFVFSDAQSELGKVITVFGV